MTLTPAYGRDYKNKLEALKDFHNGKDFIFHTIQGTGYGNRNDLINMKIKEVNIRYKNMTQIIVAKVD